MHFLVGTKVVHDLYKGGRGVLEIAQKLQKLSPIKRHIVLWVSKKDDDWWKLNILLYLNPENSHTDRETVDD